MNRFADVSQDARPPYRHIFRIAMVTCVAACFAPWAPAHAQSVDAWTSALGRKPAAADVPTAQNAEISPQIKLGYGKDPAGEPDPINNDPKKEPPKNKPDDPKPGCASSQSTTTIQSCETRLIEFDFNSAKLTPTGLANVSNLGEAMGKPEFDGARLRIVGHTDAKGAQQYNQELSERRAESVRDVLINKYRIAGSRLEAEGRGKSQLKDPGHPFDAINRRVEVVRID